MINKMKIAVSIAIFLSLTFSSAAQNSKYISAMEKKIYILDTARSLAQLQNLAKAFERIADNEKKEWLPNYYVAHCYASMTHNAKGEIIDTYCDKADIFIKKADSISPNNSE